MVPTRTWAERWVQTHDGLADQIATSLAFAADDESDVDPVPLPDGDFGAIATVAVRSGGRTIAHVGAIDLTTRQWTTEQRDSLRDLSQVLLPVQPSESEPSRRSSESATTELQDQVVPGEIDLVAKRLTDELSLLDTALTPLVEAAQQSDDPAQRRRAASVASRFETLRLRHDHLDEIVNQAGVTRVRQMDLSGVVASALAEAEMVDPEVRLRADLPARVLLTMGDPDLAHSTVVQLVQRLSSHADAPVQVRVRQGHLAGDQPAAELSIVSPLGLDALEVTQTAGLLARAVGTDLAQARVRTEVGSTTVRTTDLTLQTTAAGTDIRLRWRLITS